MTSIPRGLIQRKTKQLRLSPEFMESLLKHNGRFDISSKLPADTKAVGWRIADDGRYLVIEFQSEEFDAIRRDLDRDYAIPQIDLEDIVFTRLEDEG